MKPVLTVRMESAGEAGAAQRRALCAATHVAVREARLSQDGRALAGTAAMRFMTRDGLEVLGAAFGVAGEALRLLRRCEGRRPRIPSFESEVLVLLNCSLFREKWPFPEVTFFQS